MSPRKPSPLAARLDSLGIDPAVFAAMSRLDRGRVDDLVAGDLPTDEEKIRLRILDQPVPAKLAASRIRGRRTHGPTDAERFGKVPAATEHGSGDAGRIDGRLS